MASHNIAADAAAPTASFSSMNSAERELPRNCPGYMFLCNSSTKPDCYQYSVFGLPLCKIESVEKIEPGTILFLYDFDAKLLHGIYQATSPGKLNWEPAAFGGKFPAQVKFEILEECSPVPESIFRQVMKDNWRGTKYKLKLNKRQVKRLLSLFHSFSRSSTHPELSEARPPPVRPMTEEAHRMATPPSYVESQLWPIRWPTHMEFLYYDWMQYQAAPVVQPWIHVQIVNPLERRGYYYTDRTYVGSVYPSFYLLNPRFFP